MKKLLKAILFISIIFIKVRAYELTYSDWSTTYPEGYEEMFIESEKRYLWYKETRINEEYLRLDQAGNKEVDKNDYIYSSDSEPSIVRPEEIDERIIHEFQEPIYYDDRSIKKIKLYDYDFYDNVKISEIDITDTFSGEKIICTTNDEFLIDGDLDNYYDINHEIEIVFNDYYKVDELSIIIYYESVSSKSSLMLGLLSDDNHKLFRIKYTLDGDTIIVDERNLMKNFARIVTKYTYIDKLYKTYDIDKVVTNDYYKEYDGYQKIEESETMFYRYITNDKVLVDGFGRLVTDRYYCVKEDCYVKYVIREEKEEETPQTENPKTIDNINIYIYLFLISFVILVIIYRRKIFLVLSNLFKRK